MAESLRAPNDQSTDGEAIEMLGTDQGSASLAEPSVEIDLLRRALRSKVIRLARRL